MTATAFEDAADEIDKWVEEIVAIPDFAQAGPNLTEGARFMRQAAVSLVAQPVLGKKRFDP